MSIIKYIFEIKDKKVVAQMQANIAARAAFLKTCFAKAKEMGIGIGLFGEGISGGTLRIVADSVPSSERTNWKSVKDYYVPRKNTKRGKELFIEMEKMKLQLPSVIGDINEALGVDESMILEQRQGPGFVIRHTVAGMAGKKFVCFVYTKADAPVPSHSDYVPLKEWEYQKLIEESKERAK